MANKQKLEALEELIHQMQATQHRDSEKATNLTQKVDGLEQGVQKIQDLLENLLLKGTTPQDTGKAKVGEHSSPIQCSTQLEQSHERRDDGRGPGYLQQTPPVFTLETIDQIQRRMELPVFDGEDPDDWVVKIDQYFDLSRVPEHQRLDSVMLAMTGDALAWFRWERSRNPSLDWKQLKCRILETFSSTQTSTLCERLFTLRQEGSTREYCRDFITLAAQQPGLPEKVLETTFMVGLRSEIRNGVRLFQPKSLERMMLLAQGVESWVANGGREVEDDDRRDFRLPFSPLSSSIPRGPTNPLTRESTKESRDGHMTSSSISNKPNISAERKMLQNPTPSQRRSSFRWVTEAEARERRAKGLCFHCEERYSIGHRCKNRDLQVMIVREDGTSSLVLDSAEPAELKQFDTITELAELSLNSVLGLSSPKTMKYRGMIKDKEVVVMIDCGASHNFISDALVPLLQLPTEGTTGYGVLMGTGLAVRGQGVCRGVKLKVQHLDIKADFLPLELGSADVILGMQWLTTLGKTEVDWQTQTMRFSMNGTTVILRGDPALCDASVSLKILWKAIYNTEQNQFAELGVLAVFAHPQLKSFVSQLKKALGVSLDVIPIPPQLSEDRILLVEPEMILAERLHPVTEQLEVLIKWKDLPDYECSWESRQNLARQFPQFNLEDKVNFDPAGIDMFESSHPPIIYEYIHKKKEGNGGQKA